MVANGAADITGSTDVTNNVSNRSPLKNDLRTRESNGTNDSLTQVRNHLHTVIGRMGQDLNPSSDADNEESLFSSASIISSVLKVKQQKEGLLGGKHGAKEAFENGKYVKCDCICCQHGRFVYKPKFFQTKIEESECNTCIVERCECLTCPSPRRMSKPEPGPKSVVANGKNKMVEWLCNKKDPQANGNGSFANNRSDLYRIEMRHSKKNETPPKRFVFDLVENVKSSGSIKNGLWTRDVTYRTYDCKTNQQLITGCQTSACQDGKLLKCFKFKDLKDEVLNQKDGPKDTKKEAKRRHRVDIYYFDHGNSEFLRTTDSYPQSAADAIGELTEEVTAKFWADVFGTLNIGCAFLISFILQFIRFILYSIIRPLTVGVIQLVSDYFFKPCLAVTFNGVIQPPLILCFNIATSVRDLLEPIAESFGFFMGQVARVFKSCRLIENKYYDTKQWGEHTV